jgi:hypothetical protein
MAADVDGLGGSSIGGWRTGRRDVDGFGEGRRGGLPTVAAAPLVSGGVRPDGPWTMMTSGVRGRRGGCGARGTTAAAVVGTVGGVGVRTGSSSSGVEPRLSMICGGPWRSGDELDDGIDRLLAETSRPRSRRRAERRLRVDVDCDTSEMSS